MYVILLYVSSGRTTEHIGGLRVYIVLGHLEDLLEIYPL